MADDDAKLLAAARSGDRHAIDELLARYELPIYRFGLRMCSDEETARDVLQETMLAAFRHLPSFRGDAALSTWLYQIARSFCIKQRRGARPTQPIDEAVVDRAPEPDVAVHARQIGAALAAAIAGLPAEQREAVVLRDVEGLSASEAAAVIGVEVGALKSRLHRARMALRERLAGLVERTEDPCPALADEVSAYAAAEIDQATCARIEAHLASCPRCSQACEALKRTVSLCKSIPGESVPERVRMQVRSALRDLIAG
jgi:RNA polymerase sigma-70 factor, ECF subfamily